MSLWRYLQSGGGRGEGERGEKIESAPSGEFVKIAYDWLGDMR